MTGTMMPKSKKPLKDPNKKGPLDKFAPIFAVVGLVYALVNGTFSILDWTKVGAREKQQEKRIENFIKEEVDMQVRLRFPDTTGPVLKKFIIKIFLEKKRVWEFVLELILAINFLVL